ncbi:hypothetical protein KXD93_11435 [Mucilaginibacter sp. BJC16-A38]|uniref:hypothetical protein n=1 Tax=Mucilaginibacter phenanthrenivorans TaxID=1234842 RepID=UPI002157F4D2|nr:hypothetical protein [Mucilaginibacter phenanthrenivorans]MCR8558262.1 hypothetical protein [Mucilaginibacter phenanthrenivorans]
MSKLIRFVFGIIIMVFISFTGYGQRRVLVPVQPYNPAQRPVERYNQRPTVVKQAKPAGGRKIQAVKESFISQRLKLTNDEAKAFWPLYRKYNEELTAVRILKRINNSSSTADGAKQVEQDLQYESQLVEIKRKYRDQFYKILPPEKVSILYKSEREFNDEALKILSERSVRAGD